MKLRMWFIPLVIVFLLLILLAPANASSVPRQVGDGPDSAKKPIGYSPTYIPAESNAPTGSADILLIQTSLPWDSNANTIVLDGLGYSYDIVDIGNLGSVNLFAYPVILIVNDQAQAFYDTYANKVSDFESYVTAGGVLLFFAASDGWAGGTLNANLPGGVEVVTPHYEYYNYITNNSHPIVTAELSDGVALSDADLYGQYCSHGYFQSLAPDTQIIFTEANGYPTMIDYPLGAGRVIASTNTWEFHYIYDYGEFARKALDDVFLYALSGGGSIVQDLSVDLKIEDAPDTVEVRKSPNSYVDIVARLQGAQAYSPSVTLEVPEDKLGTPVTVFTRNLPDGSGSQSTEPENLGNGRYRVTTTLVEAALNNQTTFLKEVVWRFQVPDNMESQLLAFEAVAVQEGLIITNNIDTAKVRIADSGNAILVTNREQLFNTYGEFGWSLVSSLLEEVYRAASQQTGEVFYIDRYNINWSETKDEALANATVEEIDDRIEEWYDELKGGFLGLTQKPDYLVIVGGDRIIPFYRADDDDYSRCFLGDSLVTCEDDLSWTGNGNTVIHDAYSDNYFLTDNYYADVGGPVLSPVFGDLELAIGRIVGNGPLAMQSLIQNGYTVPNPITSAGMASVGGSDVDKMSKAFEDRNITKLGESDPELVENDKWRADDFVEVWDKDWQLFYYGAHSNPYDWYTGHKDGYSQEIISQSDLGNSNIAKNHSLLLSGSCNFAVPIVTGQTYNMVDEGFSGIVGSTGLSAFNGLPWFTDYGEQLDNAFMEELVSGSDNTKRFGMALRDAKRGYNPISDTGHKTMLEYVYYGLPWAYASLPETNLNVQFTSKPSTDYDLAISIPSISDIADLQVTVSATVDNYTIETSEGFDILVIDGTEVITDPELPALPYIDQIFYLPPGSSVSSLNLVSENSVDLGTKNLPAVRPTTSYDTDSGLLPFEGSGLFPDVRWSYEVVQFPEYTAVEVRIFLATFDGDSDVLTLFDSTELVINYTPAASAVINSFAFSQPSFVVGNNVTGSFEIQNVTAENRTFTARLTLLDSGGGIVDELNVPAFDVAPGATSTQPFSWSGVLAHGYYEAVITLFEASVPFASGEESFDAVDGQVTAFETPVYAQPGVYADITLSFANYGASEAEVVAEVLILDGGIEVGKLLQRTFTVPAGSQGSTTWLWDPGDFAAGTYTLVPEVSVSETNYNAPQEEILVSSSPQSWTNDYTYSQGWSVDMHIRETADVNNDDNADIIGFGSSAVYVALSESDYSFGQPQNWIRNFAYLQGWRLDKHVRTVADVNGDGMEDIVGFGANGVFVSLSNGSDFDAPTKWSTEFGYLKGWRVEKHLRKLADVNGDGRADIVGFGANGAFVALSNGSGFNAPVKWSSEFGYLKGWTVDRMPREVADVDGDGKADIVGFGGSGTYVALSDGSSFGAPVKWIGDFGYNHGWSITKHARELADVNNDGLADIVGFGDAAVYTALSTGSNFNAKTVWTEDYSYDSGWRVEKYPRMLADHNGDGREDIAGFGNSSVYILLSPGNFDNINIGNRGLTIERDLK